MDPVLLSYGLAVALGGGLFVWRQRDRRIKRALRSVSSRPIERIRDGEVAKLVGKIVSVEGQLTAPLTDRPCAYYLLTVEEGVAAASGAPLIREERRASFVLDDGTGQALVVLEGAEIAVVRDVHQRSGVFSPLQPRMEAYLNRHGMTAEGAAPKRLRYIEGILEVGEAVAVGGLCRWEVDPRPPVSAVRGFRDAPRRLVVRASGEMPLLVSDEPSALGEVMLRGFRR
jgi:hypothetical protein